jgi:DNA sulfur modification protein DndD
MSTDLRILGWTYRSIRGGIRDLVIDLSGSPRWTLIQMPNGTGKTTTMTLLRAALTGAELTAAEVVDLRSEDGAQEGGFELRLEIGGKPYRIDLELDFVRRTASYRTTRAQLQGGGSEPGWHLPLGLKRLLTPEFARLFVFDGEFAKEIRSVDKDRTTTSIRTLYRLDQLDQLTGVVNELVREEQAHAAEVTSASKQQGLTRLTRARDEAAQMLAALQEQQRSLAAEQAAKRKRAEEVRKAVADRKAEDERINSRRRDLDVRMAEVSSEVTRLTTASLTAFRSPASVSPLLLARMRSLGDRLTTLKLPKTISTEFFQELANSPTCVCEREIGEVEKKAILTGACKYLAEDQITVINRMKGKVRESVATGRELGDAAGELKLKIRERRQLQQQIDLLLQEQVAAGDNELDALLHEQVALRDRLEQVAARLDALATTDRYKHLSLQLDWRRNVPLCRAELATRQRKLATATSTYNFVQAAERVSGIVARVSERALEGLRESVRDATNQKLERLVPGEPLRVSRIGSRLELTSEGHESKGGVSEGQSLSVAYAFLTSLLSAAPYRLPFVVDSPAVSLDTQVRREVGEVIPELFDQMIMFVISSERDGFADAFYPRTDVKYLTIWREGAGSGRMVEGLDAFRAFHSIEREIAA